MPPLFFDADKPDGDFDSAVADPAVVGQVWRVSTRPSASRRFHPTGNGHTSAMRDSKRLRGAIAEALCAVRRGDEQQALRMFDRLAGSSWLTLRGTVLELADANFEMLLAMTGNSRDDDLVVTLATDEDAGSVDDLEPPQRTATRVLLALAAHHPDDAEAQLDIAAEADDPEAVGHVLAHTVSWTLDLVNTCQDTGKPVPTWLHPVLSDR